MPRPASLRWYRNWAVTRLLVDHLQAMRLDWPQPDIDIEAERKRLAAT